MVGCTLHSHWANTNTCFSTRYAFTESFAVYGFQQGTPDLLQPFFSVVYTDYKEIPHWNAAYVVMWHRTQYLLYEMSQLMSAKLYVAPNSSADSLLCAAVRWPRSCAAAACIIYEDATNGTMPTLTYRTRMMYFSVIELSIIRLLNELLCCWLDGRNL